MKSDQHKDAKTERQAKISLLFITVVIAIPVFAGIYWLTTVEPQFRAFAMAESTALSQAYSENIVEILETMEDDTDYANLLGRLDRMLLFNEPASKTPLLKGVTLEVDTSALHTGDEIDKFIKVSMGDTYCSKCFIARIPLYTGQTKELLGEATFYNNEEFFVKLRDRVRKKLYIMIFLSVVFLIPVWWYIKQSFCRIARFTEELEETVKKRTSELRESEEKYRSVVDNIGVGISLISSKMEILALNNKMKEWFPKIDTEKKEICYKSFNNPPKEEICSYCPTIKTLLEGKTCTSVTETPSGGEVRNYRIISTPLTDHEGNVRAAIEMVEDISERLKIEEQLRNYERIVSTSREHMSIINRDYIYITVNDAYLRAHMTERESIEGRSVREILGEDIFEQSVKKNLDTCLSGEQVNYQAWFNFKGLGRIYMDVWYYPIVDSAGAVTGIVVNAKDITERKKMEERLIESQRLESVGTLAGGIAHDFNNILVGILLNIQFVRKKITASEKINSIFEIIELAIKQANFLTDQLITFSKGGSPVKKVKDIGLMLREVASFVLTGTSVRSRLEIHDRLIAEVDENQIRQVFGNVLMNSVQAMPVGGVTDIVAEPVELDRDNLFSVNAGPYIRILIKDYGTGISEENIAKVFDPFFTTKRKGKGLGLSTSYFIIRKHQGYINIESEPGVGTVCTICLPAVEKELSETYIEQTEIAKGSGKILVMDDEEIIREACWNFLTELGYETEVAEDGEKAVELYKQAIEEARPFDIIILDLTVPGGMGGEEALRQILETDVNANALVMSGYSNVGILSNYGEYGFKGVLHKPFTIEQLSHVVVKTIEKGAAFRSGE